MELRFYGNKNEITSEYLNNFQISNVLFSERKDEILSSFKLNFKYCEFDFMKSSIFNERQVQLVYDNNIYHFKHKTKT